MYIMFAKEQRYHPLTATEDFDIKRPNRKLY